MGDTNVKTEEGQAAENSGTVSEEAQRATTDSGPTFKETAEVNWYQPLIADDLPAFKPTKLFTLDSWRTRGKQLAAEYREERKRANTEIAALEIGDWFIEGKTDGKLKMKVLYEEAKKVTGKEHGTLKNWMMVSRAFPPERRRKGIGFSVYKELVPLGQLQQDEFLDKAAAHFQKGNVVTVGHAKKFKEQQRQQWQQPKQRPDGQLIKLFLSDANYDYLQKQAGTFRTSGHASVAQLLIDACSIYFWEHRAELKESREKYDREMQEFTRVHAEYNTAWANYIKPARERYEAVLEQWLVETKELFGKGRRNEAKPRPHEADFKPEGPRPVAPTLPRPDLPFLPRWQELLAEREAKRKA